MILQLGVRFIVGGLTVAAFAALGEVVRPKKLAGIFAAAPSVALATLALTAFDHHGDYLAAEGRAMIVGATALVVYVVALGAGLRRWPRASAWALALPLWIVWSAVAILGGMAMGSS